ncbi:putative toxin-antitoxin system toxin component, PIN family [Petrimonas sp.]|uniref:putative toxin-antitoxin system toxin component, PIN family n=1 Tax=Petrimonas sp. TaxID=2023866 RepID=UPI003F51A078
MQKSKPLRLVIDTNIWISLLISKKLETLDNLFFSKEIEILFSEELIDELKVTISKPKLKKHFGKRNALEEMLLVFEPYMDFIEVKKQVNVCRDEKDNFLLALAEEGEVDYLITGDDDLLVLRSFKKTRIITISDFLKMM